MFKFGTAGKKEQFCRHTGQINVYTYLRMSILFCTFVIEIRTLPNLLKLRTTRTSANNYDNNKSNKHHLREQDVGRHVSTGNAITRHPLWFPYPI